MTNLETVYNEMINRNQLEGMVIIPFKALVAIYSEDHMISSDRVNIIVSMNGKQDKFNVTIEQLNDVSFIDAQVAMSVNSLKN